MNKIKRKTHHLFGSLRISDARERNIGLFDHIRRGDGYRSTDPFKLLALKQPKLI